ncbi:MAG TPA: O-antigen ligase family protein [Bryobacteraceae bacterium]|nr:O-antigen ligase family protein [Bryobacteraceae bacterium]
MPPAPRPIHEPEPRGRVSVLLIPFAIALVYGIFALGIAVAQENIANRQRRDIFTFSIALLGILAVFLWGRTKNERPETPRRETRIMTWVAACLPCYALLQMIPLPVGLVNLLSPARGELVRSLQPLFGSSAFASLSIAPSSTYPHVLLFAAYCVIFFAVREFSRSARSKVWVVAAPLVVAGALEAAFGFTQFLLRGDRQPTGTFGLRNHLAGFLEMTLPLPAMYGIAALRSARHGRNGMGGLPWAIGAFALTGLMLAGAVTTLSRGGFAGILASALAIFALVIGRGMPPRKRLLFGALFFTTAIFALFFLTPETLIERLSQHSTEGRVTLWREGIGVIREFPLVGCGLGGFESAFQKFKASEGVFLVDYVHNDYLQYLAELGIAGFLLAATLIVIVSKRSVEMALDASELRWIGLACAGSLTAILVHSVVDFNLYVPANAAVLAWICGMVAGLRPSSPRIVSRRRPAFAEVAVADE